MVMWLPEPLDLHLISPAPLGLKLSLGCGSERAADRLCQPCERQVDAKRSQGKEVSKLGSKCILAELGEEVRRGDELWWRGW